MKGNFIKVSIVALGLSAFMAVSADRAAAQGPAGAGASEAAKETSHTSHSMNPIKWVNATEACASFTALNECLAALHASHNLGLDFTCLRASMTGVHTSDNVSACKAADGEKALPLNKAIHALNPGANVKGATKTAEQQAKDDLKDLGS
jgi:hypothetical protein